MICTKPDFACAVGVLEKKKYMTTNPKKKKKQY